MKTVKRGFMVFLSVVIMWISVGTSYFDANRMVHVNAIALELGAVVAEEVGWDLLLAFLVSIGILYDDVIDNKDEIVKCFHDYLEVPYERQDDTAMQLYNSATGEVTSISWDEFFDSFLNFEDFPPDSLTGVYAQFSPDLIQGMKDYVSAIVGKEIYIGGVTEVIDSCCDQYDIAAQWNGEVFDYKYTILYINTSGNLCRMYYKYDYIPSYVPLAFVYSVEQGYFDLYQRSYSGYVSARSLYAQIEELKNGKWVHKQTTDAGIVGVGILANGGTLVSANANFPIFTSKSNMENYLKGIGSVDDALNYSKSISDPIEENDDLPLWGNYADELWERVARAPDVVGIGSYGAGVDANEWADYIPFIGLDDLQDYANSVPDVVGGVIDDIIDDSYPDADMPSYGDAWVDGEADAWNNVIRKAVPSVPKEDGEDKSGKDDGKDTEEPEEGGRFTEEEIQEILNDIKGDGFKNNPLRQAYENEVRALKGLGEELLAGGMSLEEVARTLWQARRDLGIQYKDMTPELLREYIYEINLDRYEDKLGPSFEYLTDTLKKSFQDIIDSASRPNSDIDELLKDFEKWLRRQ